MQTPDPTVQEYMQALHRLRRKAMKRKAVMTRGFNISVELPALDEEEIRDKQICQRFQETSGFIW